MMSGIMARTQGLALEISPPAKQRGKASQLSLWMMLFSKSIISELTLYPFS
jgi:hypothetical protein